MFAWLVRLLGPQKSQRVEPPPKPKPVEIDPNAPVVNLSPDAMEITLCWPDPASLDLNRLIVALEDLPLELKLDEDALQAVLDRAAGGEDVLGEVLIAGQPVVQGHPGQINWAIDISMTTGLEDDTGNVDFKSRGFGGAMTDEGDLIARVEAAKPGVDGWNLRGEVLTAELVEEVALEPGDGVRQAGNRYFATRDGRVTVRRDTVHVDEVMEIAGDVDYSVGHVHLRRLGVVIRGSVAPGFEVITGGPIEIRGSVEEAVIASRTDVTIRGGVLHRESGSVRCCGVFIAKYLQHAEVKSTGDILVSSGIVNSTVNTTAQVLATGRAGRIVGGVTTARRGIAVRRLGSSAGVRTVVRVGAHQEAMDQLDEECARLEAQRDRLRLLVGQSVDPEDHAELAQCVRVLRELASERTKIQEMTDAEVRVRVEGTVYPGATIVICGIIHQVKTPTDRVEFRLDLETNAVIMGPLSKD